MARINKICFFCFCWVVLSAQFLGASIVEKTRNIYIWTTEPASVITDGSTMGRARLELEPLGYKFIQVKSLNNLVDPALIIACDVPRDHVNFLRQYPRSKLILMTWEPPSVKPFNFDVRYHKCFSRVYTWHDELIDNTNYFKFYYHVMYPMTKELVDFEHKKLCVMVANNKKSDYPGELYSQRVQAIEFFNAYHPNNFDLGGHGWPNYKTYKGVIGDKIAFIKNYKFCMCYENIKTLPGYVTEKIFDCFQAGCIPVYWGAPNIENYVPKNCFIDRRDFKSYDELYQFITAMSKQTYETYLENIRIFLASDNAHLFSPRYFIDSFKEMIVEMTKSQIKSSDTLQDPSFIAPNLEFKDFVLIIPSYNNARYYKQNLDSVFSQTYQNYRIIYVDDASPDNTGNLVAQYVKEKNQEHRVTLIKNDQRVGALANTYKAARICYPHEIVIILDGDDKLHDPDVLAYLNNVYRDPQIWMTYGQFMYVPANKLGIARQVPDQIIMENEFRSYPWVTSAPRTFYAALFHKIHKEDLMQDSTNFFQYAADLAYMFPMLEMAGIHSRFIGKVLYDYNRMTPINDDKVSRKKQMEIENNIRAKQKYKMVNQLF